MSDFTIKNIMEVEDATGGQMPDVEARFGRKHLDSEHLGVSYFRYGPNFRSSMGHSHREQEEAYVVVAGSGRVKLDDEILDLRQWDVLRVAPHVVGRLREAPKASSSSPSAPIVPRRAMVCPSGTGGPTSVRALRGLCEVWL